MNRAERAGLVVELVDRMRKHGGWSGATHLQKCLFFLQEALDVPLGYDFMLYKHGPFSFNLRDELTTFQFAGVLELRANQIPYGPSFVATERGNEIRSRVPTAKEYEPQVKFVADHFGRLGVTALERLSTALLLSKEFPKASRAELAERVHELKPHISIERAVQAIDQLKALEAEAP